MPENVELTHPGLPGRRITVRPAAVPHHQRAGWQLVAEAAEAAAVRIEKTAARIKSRIERATNTSEAEIEPEATPDSDDQSADNKEN